MEGGREEERKEGKKEMKLGIEHPFSTYDLRDTCIISHVICFFKSRHFIFYFSGFILNGNAMSSFSSWKTKTPC